MDPRARAKIAQQLSRRKRPTRVLCPAGRAKQKPLMTCIRSLGEEPCSPHFPDYLVQVPATSAAALCPLPARGGNRREVPVQREGEDIIFHNI